ncbi:MAG: ADP-ribosylation factor-like protein [Promethearchaeota archaeon]
MLRHVYIIRDNDILFEKEYGKSINKDTFLTVFNDLKNQALSSLGKEIGHYLYYRYRISYIVEKDLKFFIIFITGLSLSENLIEKELKKFFEEFMDMFGEMIYSVDPSTLSILDPIIDNVHRNLRPKISLVGFAGVGKTTITRLIKAEEIPMEHIPTITGDRATIKIGKLEFNLWDFAGQEQFSYLWNNFIKGSDAVLLIVDSTLENVEKSKFFIELIKAEAPYANAAVIANKQDLPDALSPDKVKDLLGLKAYSMIAIDPDNREKMIQIIADILEMSAEVSPLLKPLKERDSLIEQAEQAIAQNDFNAAVSYFDRLSEICLELGDDVLAKEFYEKAEKLRGILNVTQ